MVKIIGIPYDSNSSFLKGSSFAPDRIRLMEKEGSANSYSENGIEIKKNVNFIELGDIVFEETNPEKAYHKIENQISELISNNEKVISIGGDHSITFPIISAFSKRIENINILHLDAHSDLYDNFDNNIYSSLKILDYILIKKKI